MASDIELLVGDRFAPATMGAVFTAATKTIIDAFKAHNASNNVVTLEAHLAPPGGSAVPRNRLMSAALRPGESYLCAELVGLTVPAGWRILMRAGAASSIAIAAGGRVKTA